MLKYLGPDDGTPYVFGLPPLPLMQNFEMPCEECGEVGPYGRDELIGMSIPFPPPPDFVNQF